MCSFRCPFGYLLSPLLSFAPGGGEENTGAEPRAGNYCTSAECRLFSHRHTALSGAGRNDHGEPRPKDFTLNCHCFCTVNKFTVSLQRRSAFKSTPSTLDDNTRLIYCIIWLALTHSRELSTIIKDTIIILNYIKLGKKT